MWATEPPATRAHTLRPARVYVGGREPQASIPARTTTSASAPVQRQQRVRARTTPAPARIRIRVARRRRRRHRCHRSKKWRKRRKRSRKVACPHPQPQPCPPPHPYLHQRPHSHPCPCPCPHPDPAGRGRRGRAEDGAVKCVTRPSGHGVGRRQDGSRCALPVGAPPHKRVAARVLTPDEGVVTVNWPFQPGATSLGTSFSSS